MGHPERASFKRRWKRQAAPIAAGVGALVLSISALALATALHERAADAVLALSSPPPAVPAAAPPSR